MKKILLASIIAVTAAAGPSQAQQTTTKDQLIGSWKVLNLKATTRDTVTYPLGEQLSEQLGVPVRLGNDVTVAVQGEFELGAGKPYDTILGVW